MATWDALRADIAPEVDDCPGEMIDSVVRLVAIDFCRRTQCYQVRATVPDAGGVGARALTSGLLPAGTRLVSLVRATFNGDPILPVSEDYLVALYGNWQAELGTPLFRTRSRADTAGAYWLVPAPSAASSTSLVLTSALMPDPAATGLDDAIMSEFWDTLVLGAKARLLAMSGPGISWANVQMAGVYAAGYESALAAQAAITARGFDRAKLVTRPQPF